MEAIESTDSSSPIVTRAVAAGLQDQYIENFNFPPWQKYLLIAMGALPQGVARFAICRFQSISGLPPELMDNFSIDELVHQRLYDYANVEGSFPAITIGAALGGATAYLSLSLGGPFLPQTFVTTLKHGSSTGNVDEYLHRSLDTALRIADEVPGLMTIQHYDPVHDGWLTRFINHLRFKLIDLPQAYEEFIKKKLIRGGAIVYLEGGASWLRYRVGPRSVFQVGGWGGISAEEYLSSSDRLRRYARSAGLTLTDWSLKGYPLESGPESEWGTEPGLDSALENFCAREGFRFVRIHLAHPNDFSHLAFNTAKALLIKENRQPAGVQVEMFSQFDATAARRSGLLPLWLIFNTEDSLDYLIEMRKQFPEGKPVFFSPLATFSLTPDLVPWKKWEAALEGVDWFNIGTRSSHYPADSRALVKWAEPLHKWVDLNSNPITSHLSANELFQLSQVL